MQIRVSNLSVARGGIPVLQGVDFACSAGQALVMRGPNGIGKTTLLRTLAGLQPALSGTIEAPEDSIAYAAHSDGIKATLTVRENLEFWAAVFGNIDIAPALSAFDLNGLIDRAAGALSAGQKRRLGLARLLVTGRPIWILDEPTVSLDVDAVQLFANTVRAHLGGGGIAIIATHIDLGLDADILQIAPFKATAPNDDMLDEAFL